MKAIVFDEYGGPEVLRLAEVPNLHPGPGELLIKVHATALNRADLLQRQGHYPPPPGASEILGLEVAGEVAGWGAGVDGFELGDRVCGLLAGGGYAEQVVLPAALALRVPEQLTYVEAAAIPEVFLTAYQALCWLAQLTEGERVLIHAEGSGVGTAAIQLAKQVRASQIIITASAAKHELCRKLGATHTIDYRSEDFAERVSVMTDKRGVDVVVDFVGGPNFAPNLQAMAPDGRMVMLGFLGGAKTEALNLLPIIMKRLKVMGSTLRARELSYKEQLTAAVQKDCWEAFAKRELRPVVDSVYHWTEVQAAHKYMATNANTGKIVLSISPEVEKTNTPID